MFIDDGTRVLHMIEAAERIQELVSGKSLDDVRSDWIQSFALIKAIEVFGEAASKTSRNYRKAHPTIEWRDIVDLRNHLIHDYLSFDLGKAWAFATKELPPVFRELQRILSEE